MRGEKLTYPKKLPNWKNVDLKFLIRQKFDELKLEETEPFYPKTYGIEPTYDIFDVKWFIDILLKKPKEERKQYIEHWFTSCDSEERNIPIGSLSAREVYLFITESGRIVTNISLIGNSIKKGVSNVIQNYGCGFLSDNMKKLYNNDI